MTDLLASSYGATSAFICLESCICPFTLLLALVLVTKQVFLLFVVLPKCINIKYVACPNCTELDTALVWVVSNKPVKCEADQMNGSPDMPITDRQTDRASLFCSSSLIFYHVHQRVINFVCRLVLDC